MKTIMWISAVLCWLVPSALASFAADGCVASGEVPKVTQPQLAAALCCRDGDWCDSDIGGRCHGDSVGFAEASDLCASRAARVCTLAELASRICCDTGCGYDGLAAWYDNCVSNPCVHGTCASTKESYTCTCDADFTGDDCDEAILTTLTGGPSAPGPSTPQPSTPGPSTSGSSQTFAPAPGQESSRGELFGAHSFDFLNEEIEKLKARMVNRTAEASAEALEALGVEDVLSRITNNGELKELEEQAKDKWSELFGDFFDMGNFSFDIGDAFEPVMERAGNVLKTCSSSRLPQDPQARSAQALAAEDDLVLMANRTLGQLALESSRI
ncbi:hypothetical protein DIPPA_24301 [Diplonema papillatum]|nr:hypothetical protein DIPPA_24301 [Diplonema papillatum]